MDNNLKILMDLLKSGDIESAASHIMNLRKNESINIELLIYLSSDIEEGVGLAAYTLLSHLMSADKTDAVWHKIARDVLSNNLCHYRGSYAGALYHARQVCQSEPGNLSAWEIYLDIGANRAKLLNKEEIERICRSLLLLEPGNISAGVYLNK